MRLSFRFLVVWLCTLPAISFAQEPEFTFSVDAPPENDGSFEAICRLTSAGLEGAPTGAAGWSLSLEVSGGVVTGFTTAGTDVETYSGGPGNSFETTQLASDANGAGVVSAVVLGLSDPQFLPLAGTFDILRVTVDATDPCEARLRFRDGLTGGGQPVKNRVTHQLFSFVPRFRGATSRTGEFLANAGPDGFAEETTAVTLTGSAEDTGDAVFQWRQVSGPEVTAIEGQETSSPTLVLPPVDGDQEVILEFAVEDGACIASDQVAVTVIDGDLRSFDLSATSSPRTLGDGRVVVFDGSLSWGTGLEEGLWEGVRFTASGAGNEATLVSGLALYLDSGDGAFDASDRLLGEETVGSNNGRVLFAFPEPLELTEGVPVRFFLVATPTPDEPQAAFLFPLLLVGLGATFGLRIRGGVRTGLTPALAALLFGALLVGLGPVACGGGGGGGGASPVESSEVRFGIAQPDDVLISGAATGVAGRGNNASVRGPAVDL